MSFRRSFQRLAILALALIVFGAPLSGQPAGAVQQVPSGRALVWQVGGSPGSPAGLGSLFWREPGETPINVSDMPNEGDGTRVFACGGDALSRDGNSLIVYVGANLGSLFRVSLTGEVGEAGFSRWGGAHALTCNGRGNAAYSPDGSRWAYIQFANNAARASYPSGTLRILEGRTGEEEANLSNVVAFALRNDGAYVAQFYDDQQGHADELAITWWDGSSARELAALHPNPNCFWTSARLAVRSNGSALAVSAGESCTGGSMWRIFTLTPDGEPTERIFMPSGGMFAPDAYSNQATYLSGGNLLLAAYPNGLAKHVVNLVMVTPQENGVTLISPFVVADSYPNGRAGNIQFAPDGTAVAFVTANANGAQAIHLLPLDGSLLPATISAGTSGEAISTFFFTPDGSDLLYVAGGRDGAENSLFALRVGETEARLVARGNFLSAGGLAGDGVALLLENVPPDSDHRRAAVNLVVVSLADGSKTVLVEGRAENAWAYPLAWRE